MIEGFDKLTGCDPRIIELAKFIESNYKNIICTSGLRTATENSKAGGAKNSAHLQGLAADFVVPFVDPCKVVSFILNAFQKFPIKGYGIDIYRGMVHFDFMDRGVKEVVKWCYDRQGRFI